MSKKILIILLLPIWVFAQNDTLKSNKSNWTNSEVSFENERDYGSNMFYFSPIIPLLGYVGIGYEHFSKSGKSSFRIPLKFQIHSNNNNRTQLIEYNEVGVSDNMVYLGYEYKFFPTGSSGGVRGFIGIEERIGMIERRIYIYEYIGEEVPDGLLVERTGNLFNETHFTGGVQFHPSKLINITLDVGLGLGLLDFEETYLSYKIGLNLGFRF